MYFHPWPLLVGMVLLGLSLYSWMSPFVMDGPADKGLDQFLGRFIQPIFVVIFIFGAFFAPKEYLPDSVWLHLALIVALLLEIFLFIRLRRQRRQWKAAVSDAA